jgi:hypothetical protein
MNGVTDIIHGFGGDKTLTHSSPFEMGKLYIYASVRETYFYHSFAA